MAQLLPRLAAVRGQRRKSSSSDGALTVGLAGYLPLDEVDYLKA
jgi:ribosomal protein L5